MAGSSTVSTAAKKAGYALGASKHGCLRMVEVEVPKPVIAAW
jgi:ABC-type phosphate transport system permease subunit